MRTVLLCSAHRDGEHNCAGDRQTNLTGNKSVTTQAKNGQKQDGGSVQKTAFFRRPKTR